MTGFLKLRVFITMAAVVVCMTALGYFVVTQAHTFEDKFIIGAYGNPQSPNINLTQFQYLADAHVNELQLSWGYSSNYEAAIQQILGLANQCGVKVQVSDIRQRPWWYEPYSHAQIDSIINDVTTSYKNYPATAGYVAFDEPSFRSFEIDKAAYAVKRFLHYHPNTDNSLNLLPTYAAGIGTSQYRNYVLQNIHNLGTQNINFLSYDFYPFPNGGGYGGDYFQNAEIFREACLKYGIKNRAVYLQTTNCGGLFRIPNENELRWNVYTNVAYGVKGYFAFVWFASVPETSGIVNYNGTKSSLYTPMQTINGEIEKLAPTLISLDSLEVYHAGSWLPAGTNPVPSGYFWQPMNNHNNHIISHFKNAAGRDYVMVVNDDYSASQTLSFNIASKPANITEVSKSTGQEVATNYSSSTGNISATFLPGEGKLYAITGSVTNNYMINDTDTNITYTGSSWVYANNSGAGEYNNDLHEMFDNDDYFEYLFNGTGVQFIGDKQSVFGTVDVYIDDVFQQTVNCYNVVTISQQVLFSKSGLTSGTHKIKVVKKSGSYMCVDAIKVFNTPIPTSTMVPAATTMKHNDTDTKILYHGDSFGYDCNRGVGEFKDDIHFLIDNDDYFEFTFTGTSVSYITNKRSNCGTVDIYVDGVFQQTVNCYNATDLHQQVVYSKSGLTPGTHTIKGVKKSGTYIDVDAFLVNEITPSALTKMSAGKTYTKSIQPLASYPDTGNAESTNEILAGPFWDGKSYGYEIQRGQTINVDITLDLSASKTISFVRLLNHNGSQQNYSPDSITVFTSTNGTDFTQKGQSISAVNGWYEVSFANTAARYVRVRATKAYGDYADYLFVDEIEVYGIQ